MIHYSCDRCHQPIDSEKEVRYSVQIEILAALDPSESDFDSDRDHLGELHEILDQLEDSDCAEISENAYQRRSYDLCTDCFKQYVKNPLALEVATNLGFSDN